MTTQDSYIEIDSYVTFTGSILSVIGSLLVVIFSHTERKKTRLIRNLAITDLVWFFASLVISCFWISQKKVPQGVCFVLSPLINFTRIASLIWTCAISWDVYKSLHDRYNSAILILTIQF